VASDSTDEQGVTEVYRMNKLFQGRLWHDRDFLLLWTGESISLIGSRVTLLALPTVAILQLHQSAFQVGLLVALGWAPFLVLSSLTGVWADRHRRRPMMVAANAGRVVLIAAVPILAALGVLSMWHLYVIALLSGILTVLFQVSFQAYLPSLLGRENFVEGNARMQLSQSVAQVFGGPIAGLLIGLLGAARAMFTDALSFLVAVFTVVLIRRPEAQPNAGMAARGVSGVLHELGEGFATVWRTLVLRNLSIVASLGNLTLSMGNAVLFVYLYRDLHLSPASVGIAIGLGGVGFIGGAILSQRLNEVIGVGRTILIAMLLLAASFLILPIASLGAALAILALSQFLAGLQSAPANVGVATLLQSFTPNRLMGRVMGVGLNVVWGANTIGGLLGGILAQALGNAWALAVFGLVPLVAILFLLGPILSYRREEAEAPTGDRRVSQT
jgi:MFS family permease